MTGRDRNIAAANVPKLGTAASQDTGTSGTKIPLLDGANTWSGNIIMSGAKIFMADQILDQPVVRDYAIENATPSSSSGTLTLDYTTGPDFSVTLTENVTTLTLSNWPASGNSGVMRVKFKQNGTGGYSVTWPAAIKWPGGTAPTQTTGANKWDRYVFVTDDGGTIVDGMQIGADFS